MLGVKKNKVVKNCKRILDEPLKSACSLYKKFHIFECLKDESLEF